MAGASGAGWFLLPPAPPPVAVPVRRPARRTTPDNSHDTSAVVQAFVSAARHPCRRRMLASASAAAPSAAAHSAASRRGTLAAALAAVAAPLLRSAAAPLPAGAIDDEHKLLCDENCEGELSTKTRVKTDSGLEFIDIVEGTGPSPPVGYQVGGDIAGGCGGGGGGALLIASVARIMLAALRLHCSARRCSSTLGLPLLQLRPIFLIQLCPFGFHGSQWEPEVFSQRWPPRAACSTAVPPPCIVLPPIDPSFSPVQVTVNYVAMTPQGRVFDDSLDKGYYYDIRVGSGQVIAGGCREVWGVTVTTVIRVGSGRVIAGGCREVGGGLLRPTSGWAGGCREVACECVWWGGQARLGV